MKTDSPGKVKNIAPRMAQNYTKAAADFERSRVDEIKRSRKLAWTITGAALLIAVMALGQSMMTTYMHKDPEPQILRVSDSSGDVTMLRSMKDAQDRYGEVVDRFWLANYVRLREGYDWWTISEQFEAVKLMSMGDVATEYAAAVQAKESPLTLYKDKAKVVAKVGSVTFVNGIGQVRFTTQKLSTSGENTENLPVQRWIATIAYKYDSGMMTDQQRLINPLGLKVLSYKVDPEAAK